MGEMAGYLIDSRTQLVQRLSQLCHENFRALFDDAIACGLTYRPSLKGPTSHEFTKNRSRDLLVGSTTLGPHRDDVEIAIGGFPQEICASEGQKRLLTLALLLSQRQMMRESLGAYPLLAIDDFSAHLDERRMARLRNELERGGQAFLTTPHPLPGATLTL